MGWEGHALGNNKCIQNLPEDRKPLGISDRKLEDNTKTDLREGMDWIVLVAITVQ
jgi:hypothetical protein